MLFPDNIFQRILFHEKVWIAIIISLKFVPKALIWQQVVVGFDNDSIPNGRQAIMWTNDDLLYRRLYTSLD